MPRKGSKRVDFENFDFDAFAEATNAYTARKEALQKDNDFDKYDGPEPSKYMTERAPMSSEYECLYNKSASGDIFAADKKKDKEGYTQALRNLHGCIFKGRHAPKLREYLRYLKITEKKYTSLVYDKALSKAGVEIKSGDPISYKVLAKALTQTFSQLKEQYVVKKKTPWE